jgi:flavin reductase (DIM6/NTAB) family NADH-FMN oxidoreductase RutF
MRDFPTSKVYHLIEQGPVVLVATADKKKKANVMTMSWHMMMEFEPPLIGCILSNRNYSFSALKATKECVIAIPSVNIINKVIDAGNCSGKDVDKFKAFGLTPRAGKKVKAPLIAECFANLECRVVNTALVNKYNLFILKVVKAWHDPKQKQRKIIHHTDSDVIFAAGGRTLNLKKRMVKWLNTQ